MLACGTIGNAQGCDLSSCFSQGFEQTSNFELLNFKQHQSKLTLPLLVTSTVSPRWSCTVAARFGRNQCLQREGFQFNQGPCLSSRDRWANFGCVWGKSNLVSVEQREFFDGGRRPRRRSNYRRREWYQWKDHTSFGT